MAEETVKLCAAKMPFGRGFVTCAKHRKEGSLFCFEHKYASNRIYLPRITTSEDLDYMSGIPVRGLNDG